jgi:hypothetical protein
MSIFSDDWRDCLQEHYRHVIRAQDTVNERSLIEVLHQVGFTDDDLRQMYMSATMHVDDMPSDFTPDVARAQARADEEKTFQPHPAECQCPACMTVELTPHDEDGQPLDAEQIAELEERDDDDPEQMSLF